MSISDNNDTIRVNDEKVLRLLKRLLIAESTNLKSKDKTDKQMIQYIQEKIKEETECY